MTDHVIVHDAFAKQWLGFNEPEEIITAVSVDQVSYKLKQVEKMVEQYGLHAAGFLSYEAAPAFDSAFQVRNQDSIPLLWFGIYDRPQAIQISPTPNSSNHLDWRPSIDQEEYSHAISRIKEYLKEGDTYQVNYTFRLFASFSGDAREFFLGLLHAQQADYAASIHTENFSICSASPELFFRLDKDKLVSRPMKGTAKRGRTLEEDQNIGKWLYDSEKNRAENLMIVDMVRNDMGRIAEAGSVKVPTLFEAERYPTLWQMTSTVTSKTSASISEIMTSLFPCASITGAPKIRTMQIIDELETTPRKIYTGCIGFMSPGRRSQFNVAIRTVLIDKQKGQAEYGVGGGIVWDSTAEDEYKECKTKAKILVEKRPIFSLFETMRWAPDEDYVLLSYHLKRLSDSAIYFDFPLHTDEVQKKLADFAQTLSQNSHKVKLTIDPDGSMSLQATPLSSFLEQRVRLLIAPFFIDSLDVFLYHKTTHREVYDSAKTVCDKCDDVILWNDLGQITETTIANIVVQKEGRLITPPVECGLLPGTFRAWLLDCGEIQEEIVTLDDLKTAEKIFVINSVRGWRDAYLVGDGS